MRRLPRPALNAAFTADGFFRTGDLAVADAEGFIRITGRRKDIIIRKGENLSAKGIEDELAAHPKVADVAVIGVPDAAQRRARLRLRRPAPGRRDAHARRACAPSWRGAA